MKLYIILVLIASILFGQDYKIVKYGEAEDRSMLVGIHSREVFQDSNFVQWFNSEYSDYKVDTSIVSKCRELISYKNIKIVLGTWCSDSRREVPRMLKILDSIGYPEENLTFLSVDRDKKGLSNEADGLNIEFVPTIIIYENETELGRIIEIPYDSLEEDLVDIVD